MGCSASTSVGVADQSKPKNPKGKKRPQTPGPKSIPFVIQLDDEDDNKSVKSNSFQSRLPKRFLRLQEEQEKSNSLTVEEIVERQKLAEKRRKSAIEGRILKSKQFQAKALGANRSENNSIKSNTSLNESSEQGTRRQKIKQEKANGKKAKP